MCRQISMGYLLGTNVAASRFIGSKDNNSLIKNQKKNIDSNYSLHINNSRRIANAAELEKIDKSKSISTCAVGWEQDTAVSHLLDKSSGKDIYLIGTAHISNASALLVKDVISAVKPTQVMIELDESRIQRMGPSKKSTSNTNLQNDNNNMNDQQIQNQKIDTEGSSSSSDGSYRVPTSEEKKQAKSEFYKDSVKEMTKMPTFRDRLVGVGAAVLGSAIRALYSTLDKSGFSSGQEFVVAVEEARKLNADILLGDRNVKVTLTRLADAMSRTDLNKLLVIGDENELKMALEKGNTGLSEKEIANFNPGDISSLATSIEKIKDRETIRVLMGGLSKSAPLVYNAMIKERDEYMANNLLISDFNSIVAVVGMAHMDGIERTLMERGNFRLLPKPIC